MKLGRIIYKTARYNNHANKSPSNIRTHLRTHHLGQRRNSFSGADSSGIENKMA